MSGITSQFKGRLLRCINPYHTLGQESLPAYLSFEVSLHYTSAGIDIGIPQAGGEVTGTGYERQLFLPDNNMDSTGTIIFAKGNEDWRGGGANQLEATHFMIWGEVQADVFEPCFYGQLLNKSSSQPEPVPLAPDNADPTFYGGNLKFDIVGDTGTWIKTAIKSSINKDYSPARVEFPAFTRIEIGLLHSLASTPDDNLDSEVDADTSSYIRKVCELDDNGVSKYDITYTEKDPAESWGGSGFVEYIVFLGIEADGTERVLSYSTFTDFQTSLTTVGDISVGAAPITFRAGTLKINIG